MAKKKVAKKKVVKKKKVTAAKVIAAADKKAAKKKAVKKEEPREVVLVKDPEPVPATSVLIKENKALTKKVDFLESQVAWFRRTYG